MLAVSQSSAGERVVYGRHLRRVEADMGWLAICGALCALAFAPLNWWWMLLFAPALELYRLYGAGISQAA